MENLVHPRRLHPCGAASGELGHVHRPAGRLDIFSPYGTIIEGALGKKTAIRQTIKLAVPLLGTALAIAPCFKMRFWNIGAEGRSRRAPWPHPISRSIATTRCPPRCC
ncbi:MAG: hypothetical protein V8T01_03950 [Oscillospiraceae bacterium]